MGLILGYNSFLSTNSNITLPSNRYYKLELQNAIFDAIEGYDDITKAYSSDKEVWEYNTALNAEFKNELEGGNVDLNGQDLRWLLFQKRRKDDLTWNTIAKLGYDSTVKLYQIMDYYIENAEIYEYCIVPLSTNLLGNRTETVEIIPNYDGIWLTDSQNNVKLLYDISQGDDEFVKPRTSIETLGGQYPIHTSSGNLDYRKGSVKATVLSDASMDGNGIDIRQEKINRNNIIDFVKSWKPKLYRNAYSGEMLMVGITSNPKFTHNNDLQGRIGEVSFDFEEVGNTLNDTDMRNNGFIE